ncbi:MAG: hypothetical protein DMD91_06725, partial [Candidatus Rokuibacteriota bacterium]
DRTFTVEVEVEQAEPGAPYRVIAVRVDGKPRRRQWVTGSRDDRFWEIASNDCSGITVEAGEF